MGVFFSGPPTRRPARMRIRRLFPRAVKTSLLLGFCLAALLMNAEPCYGQGQNTPKPTKPPNTHVPTYKTVEPSPTPYVPSTNTPVPTDPPAWTATPTGTSDCTYGPTPTVTGIPTCTPTPSPTPSPTETEIPTDTALPGGPTSTPRPTRTLQRTGTPVFTVTPTPSATTPAAGGTAHTPSSEADRITVSSSSTRTGMAAAAPLPGTGGGSNSFLPAGGMPVDWLLAVAATAGGAYFAFRRLGRRRTAGPLPSGGTSPAALAIPPAAVGALGFTAWLAGQAPLLTYGEQVVLSKVGNGIGSAFRRIGGLPDLKRISEPGTQEFLQLTAGSPFRGVAVRSPGWA